MVIKAGFTSVCIVSVEKPGRANGRGAKVEIVAQQITNDAFYERVGFWCRQCEFMPLCLGNKRKAKDTLVRIT